MGMKKSLIERDQEPEAGNETLVPSLVLFIFSLVLFFTEFNYAHDVRPTALKFFFGMLSSGAMILIAADFVWWGRPQIYPELNSRAGLLLIKLSCLIGMPLLVVGMIGLVSPVIGLKICCFIFDFL